MVLAGGPVSDGVGGAAGWLGGGCGQAHIKAPIKSLANSGTQALRHHQGSSRF